MHEIEIGVESHTYTADEKLEWFGYGEWIEEVDQVLFIYKDFECKVLRVVLPDGSNHIFGGHLCGYVRIPADHPYHNKLFQRLDIECHGGLTYGEVNVGHWIGFDCAHSGDYVPSSEHFKKNNPDMLKFRQDFPLPEAFEKYSIFNPVYRNINFCIEECKGIVDQLLAVKAEGIE